MSAKEESCGWLCCPLNPLLSCHGIIKSYCENIGEPSTKLPGAPSSDLLDLPWWSLMDFSSKNIAPRPRGLTLPMLRALPSTSIAVEFMIPALTMLFFWDLFGSSPKKEAKGHMLCGDLGSFLPWLAVGRLGRLGTSIKARFFAWTPQHICGDFCTTVTMNQPVHEWSNVLPVSPL